MSAIFLVTALLVFPAALLIVIDDKTAPTEDIQRFFKVKAKKIKDRTQLRSRLEELGRNTEKEYVDFRIKQYGYCASSAALTFVLVILLSQSLFQWFLPLHHTQVWLHTHVTAETQWHCR